MQHALGIPKPPGPGDHNGWDNAYRNVRTQFHALLELMDPSPLPKNRRFDAVDFDALVELRRASRTDEQWAERGDRLTWLINEILEMSISTLPLRSGVPGRGRRPWMPLPSRPSPGRNAERSARSRARCRP